MVAYERTGHTILVVEDDIFVRLDIAEYLRDCGYRVIEAGTAAEAIDVLESNVPIDLVFSDIQMPGEMDGFGLAADFTKLGQRFQQVADKRFAKSRTTEAIEFRLPCCC
jgi:CheY-like chemotaxis protein